MLGIKRIYIVKFHAYNYALSRKLAQLAKYQGEIMRSVLIANPKGGAGKTTLATNLTGHFANNGLKVTLCDLDRQQSSLRWMAFRDPAMAPVNGYFAGNQMLISLPKDPDWVVLDAPAGLQGYKLTDYLRLADKVIIPVVPLGHPTCGYGRLSGFDTPGHARTASRHRDRSHACRPANTGGGDARGILETFRPANCKLHPAYAKLCQCRCQRTHGFRSARFAPSPRCRTMETPC
ncbi:ParA family protein [Propionivibrio sp.]|uniref:ParA family protein n=1 Tax=Propionivibrio sp. TaxID=2212460 RepID=UPI0025F2E239|nr:ParA family protein [Propionivibrio sp.]